MPSKTLRETAVALTAVRARQLYGVDLSLRREATIADFMHHERRVTASERSRLEERLRQFGVERFHGAARFVDPHTARHRRRLATARRTRAHRHRILAGASAGVLLRGVVARRALCAIGVLISLAGSGCSTSQTTSNGAASFKKNCTESVYLTGPTFATCNNF